MILFGRKTNKGYFNKSTSQCFTTGNIRVKEQCLMMRSAINSLIGPYVSPAITTSRLSVAGFASMFTCGGARQNFPHYWPNETCCVIFALT